MVASSVTVPLLPSLDGCRPPPATPLLLLIHDHLAGLDAVGRGDDAVALHPLDDARRAVVADAEAPLHQGGIPIGG